jgi:uncharacterized protein YxeA
MHLKINLHVQKKILAVIIVLLLCATVGLFFYLKQSSKNPLPDDLKTHVSFKVIYPSSRKAQIDKNSFVYQAKQKVLTFNVLFEGNKVEYSEQEAPAELGSETQAYYPALGIHPYAQFKSNLGQIALTKFWQSGNLKPVGQSAVIASEGTFLIAHSEKNLTNNQWKDLFKSLKITK